MSAFIIHIISSLPLLSEIGLLIGRGALISVILILFVLPQLLILFDKVIEKTSFRKLKFREEGALAPVVVEPEEVKSEPVEIDDDLDIKDENSSRAKLASAAKISTQRKRATSAKSTQSTTRKATKSSSGAKSTTRKTTTKKAAGTTKSKTSSSRSRVRVKISEDTEDI